MEDGAGGRQLGTRLELAIGHPASDDVSRQIDPANVTPSVGRLVTENVCSYHQPTSDPLISGYMARPAFEPVRSDSLFAPRMPRSGQRLGRTHVDHLNATDGHAIRDPVEASGEPR